MARHARTIYFYKVTDPYGEFSNFYPHKFTTTRRDGTIDEWQTSEHFFQAHKFTASEKDFTEVRNAKTASAAAKAGRQRSRPLRADWEDVKDDVMFRALELKFKDPGLRKVLLDTADANIVEHTSNDSYWADGGDGSGKNMLGVLLMRLRDKIRADL